MFHANKLWIHIDINQSWLPLVNVSRARGFRLKSRWEREKAPIKMLSILFSAALIASGQSFPPIDWLGLIKLSFQLTLVSKMRKTLEYWMSTILLTSSTNPRRAPSLRFMLHGEFIWLIVSSPWWSNVKRCGHCKSLAPTWSVAHLSCFFPYRFIHSWFLKHRDKLASKLSVNSFKYLLLLITPTR
jgi:hypothetical protein